MEKQILADILTSNVISVTPETFIIKVLELMRNKNISCIIVAEENRPLGIVTERNLVKFIAGKKRDCNDCEIHEIMSSPLITAAQDTDIFEAYNILSTHSMRHLAVQDQHGLIAGVVTLSNIVEHLTYETFFDPKQVSQIMTRIVSVVQPEDNVKAALTMMAKSSISCILVADGKKPVGIITERDATRLLIDFQDLSKVSVANAMTAGVQTVTGNIPLLLAIDKMKREKLRHLVVVDSDGNIEGLVTQSDIVKGMEGKYIQGLHDIIREKDALITDTSRNLAEKTTYLNNILNSSIDYGIIAVNMDHCVNYFNPGAEYMFGVKAEDALGIKIEKIHNNNNGLMNRVNGVLASAKQGERPSFTIVTGDNGNSRYLSARASGIIDNQKNLIGYFLMISDITSARQAEEQQKNAHANLELRVEERTRMLSKAMRGTIEAIAMTVEMRDPYTSGHQRRVANLAKVMAKKLGWAEDKVEGIYMAGLIHDIGKIKVPSGILCYPGRLTEAEFSIIKPHPEIGYNILKGIDFPWPLAEIVLQHHERLDGSGYPNGLSGDQILKKARILAVADVMEGMSSHRPYRPSLGTDRALEELTSNRGTLYDPEAVDICVTLFTKDKFSFTDHF